MTRFASERQHRGKHRKLYVIPRELEASDGQGAGVWVLVLHDGRSERAVQLCEHAYHESTDAAWRCADAHARLAEGVRI